MKNKTLYFLLAGLIITSFFINSCKKEDKSNILNLLTTDQWQLASLQVTHYIGQSSTVDVLNTTCDTTQVFKFFKDGTCTYTNFDCKIQSTAKGTWVLSDNKLILNADITCQDTTAAGSSKPFLNAKILNLGDYSFVFETGDTQLYYSPSEPRTVYQYGFVRQKLIAR
jgi:hypothetical protein